MTGKPRRILALFLLAACCFSLAACGSSGSTETRDAVSLWLVEDAAPAAVLEELAEAYNAGLGRSNLLRVQVRAFPDEESLAAAFETARPDLLLCPHERAFSLYARGVRQDISHLLTDQSAQYPDFLERYSPSVGRAYFPIGFETQLLYIRDDAADAADRDLLTLLEQAAQYGAEEGRPFMTADSFAALLYDMLLSWETELHGERWTDTANLRYLSAYNQLADAAFTGGLAGFDIPAAALVEGGALPCGVAFSTSLRQSELESCTVFSMPRLQEGSEYLAQALGLAVTAREGRDLRSVAGFISWLGTEDRLGRAALKSGLVPAAGYDALEAEDILQTVLLELAALEAHLPAPGADFTRNRASLEQELRATFTRLN